MKPTITQRRRDGVGLTVNAADATLLEIITRCRHRVLVVLFVRQGALVCSTIVMLLAAVVYLWPPSPDVLYVWLGAATGVSLLSAASAAWLRSPTARQTAMELDRRLRLEDCVVAALQVQGSSASVAPLIVRDALEWLAGVQPGQVFPLDARKPAALVIVAMTLLLLATLPDRSSAPLARAGGGAVASASDTAPVSPSAERQDAPSGERPASARAASEGSRSRGTPGPAHVAADEPADRTATSLGERRDAAVSPDTAGRNPSPANTRAREAATRAAERGPGAMPGAGGPGGASTSRSNSGGLGASSAAGTGASGASLAPAPNGSGGIRGGTLISPQGGRAVTAASEPGSGARARDARRRAEAALERDDVPPNLRSYVHDYFLAIQPPERE